MADRAPKAAHCKFSFLFVDRLLSQSSRKPTIFCPLAERPVSGRVKSSIMRMAAIYLGSSSEQQREGTLLQARRRRDRVPKGHNLEVPRVVSKMKL